MNCKAIDKYLFDKQWRLLNHFNVAGIMKYRNAVLCGYPKLFVHKAEVLDLIRCKAIVYIDRMEFHSIRLRGIIYAAQSFISANPKYRIIFFKHGITHYAWQTMLC